MLCDGRIFFSQSYVCRKGLVGFQKTQLFAVKCFTPDCVSKIRSEVIILCSIQTIYALIEHIDLKVQEKKCNCYEGVSIFI